MESETSYIEKLIKGIVADKNRMLALVFSVLSVICSLLYMSNVTISGIHMIFIIAMIFAANANIVYMIDIDSKNKYAENIVICGIGAMLLGVVLKVIKTGMANSSVYFIGYLFYALTFLMSGLYCTKNEAKPVVIKVFLLICGAWSIFEFIQLKSSFAIGIMWKIFRISELFLAIGYFFFLNTIEKTEISISEKAGNYKKQIPSLRISIAILFVIAIISAGIGLVSDIDKSTKEVSVTQTVTEQTTAPQKTKKSTVTTATPTENSTVIPAQKVPEEIKEIKAGDTVETDSFTFKINKVELSQCVEPDNPPSYYTYYQAEAEHTYIYVNASVTNKEKHSLRCDDIYSVTADFDGGYEYKGFNIADDDDGDFTYANITSVEPLETLGVHCLIDCPELIKEEGKSLFLTISLKNGSKYKYIIK